MTVSSITPITAEGSPRELSSFLRSGVMYVVWTDVTGTDVGSNRQMRWKPHTGLDFTEVISPLVATFNNFTVLYRSASDSLLVIWDDGLALTNTADGKLYGATLDAVTGAVLSGPTMLGPGSYPRLTYRGSSSTELLLYFKTLKNKGVYGRLSMDSGVTWGSASAFITGKVLDTDSIRVLPYDDAHVSIAQAGKDSRPISELSAFKRTRPLRSIVRHPLDSTKLYVAEPSKFDNTTLTDNLRGALVLNPQGNELYHLSGVQQGTSDSIGAVAVMDISGNSVSNSSSVGPVGGVSGRNLVSYLLSLANGTTNVVLPGASSYAVDFALSLTHAYVAEYSDSSTNGQFVVVRLSDNATGTILSAITGVRAVAVSNFTLTPLIFVASTESGVERLRVYEQNDLTPTLLLNVKLPARANNISVSFGEAPETVRVFVSMVDRFGIYQFFDGSSPIRTLDVFRFPGGGQFFRSVQSTNGNIFVAAGSSGVIVFSQSGKVLAQLKTSGQAHQEWRPNTPYSLNSFVVPRARHPFAANRYYFKATTGGTTGGSEPSWNTTGTINDGTAVWTPQGVIDGICTDVALVEGTKRLYAVGSAGGNLATDGRVWVLDVNGLV